MPVGKVGRIIVLHAGSASGFIPESKLVFRAKKSSSRDYHSEMNSETFKLWFRKQFLPYLPANFVIVMDKVSYHSVVVDKVHTTSTKKGDIMLWLASKKIPHTANQTRAELLNLVALHKPGAKVYDIL